MARHALRGGRVDSERIFAALDAYLLAAFVFGVVYWVLDRELPGLLRSRVARPRSRRVAPST